MIKLSAFSDEARSGIQEQIEAMRRNGISLTELRSVGGKNVADFTLEEAAEYRSEFEKNGISVWSIGSPLGKVNVTVDFSEYMKKVRRVCEIANVFHTDKIRIFSFWNAYEAEEKVYEYLREMIKAGKEYGVEMYHENEKDIFGDTASRVEKIMKNVEGLKYIYDPANFLQCGEPAQKTLDLFHKKTSYFHIKDVIAATGEVVPAGYGDGMIRELLSRITGDTVLTLEPHLAVFDVYKSIDGTEMKHKFTYKNGSEAFDAATSALKKLLTDVGYIEENGTFYR